MPYLIFASSLVPGRLFFRICSQFCYRNPHSPHNLNLFQVEGPIGVFITIAMTTIRTRDPFPIHRIEPAANTASSLTPEVVERMNRIAESYDRLVMGLNEIEAKIQSDERLKKIDASIQEVEFTVDGTKRKWRPAKRSARQTKAPHKPR